MDLIPPGNITTASPQASRVADRLEQLTGIWQLGAFCIFGWELLVCLPKEYRLVWTKPMNIPSLLYLANRYLGLIVFCFSVALLTGFQNTSACNSVFLLEPIGALISSILSQAILGGRVFAIYGRNKVLGYFLGGLLIGEAIVGGIAISTSSSGRTAAGFNTLSLAQPSCSTVVAPFGWLVTYWTTPLLYDSLTFLLTAWKAYSIWKQETNIPIFNIIWYDGLLYFFAISSMNIVNVMILFLAPPSLQNFNMMPTVMFQVILSCRMFLHLKGSNPSTDSILDSILDRSKNLSKLRFGSRRFNGTFSKDQSKSTPASAIGAKQTILIGPQSFESDCRVKPFQEE